MNDSTGKRNDIIGRVRPLRITPQIRPVGGRSIDDPGALPGQRLAPGGSDRAHPRSHRIVGISREEFRIAIQRVAIQSRGISLRRAEIR